MSERDVPLLEPLGPTFAPTREALRAVACYVIAPARLARDAHIWLAPVDGGIGIPASVGAPWIGVRGDHLVVDPGPEAPLTTLRAAADLVGVTLDADPGVGHDLPPFTPDAALAVDAAASRALADWYSCGAAVHAELAARHQSYAAALPAKLWPEHFDLAIALDAGDGRGANVGASAGDAQVPEPYLYVGPWDHSVLESGDPFWNASFGATLAHAAVCPAADQVGTAVAFVEDALRRLGCIA